MTITQMIAAITGFLISLGAMISFFRHRTGRFKALFWLAIGLAMVYAGFRPAFIEVLGPDSIELRIRLVVALLSFVVLTVTLESIRVARMQERYAFLWLVAGALLFVGALFPHFTQAVSVVAGMTYGVTVLVVIFAFILLMLFHFSVALSRTQHKLAQIVRELALAEERIRRMETEQGNNSPSRLCEAGAFRQH